MARTSSLLVASPSTTCSRSWLGSFEGVRASATWLDVPPAAQDFDRDAVEVFATTPFDPKLLGAVKRLDVVERRPTELSLTEPQAIAGHTISREDAVESMHNLVRFFEVLERWGREDGLLPGDSSELEVKDQAPE